MVFRYKKVTDIKTLYRIINYLVKEDNVKIYEKGTNEMYTYGLNKSVQGFCNTVALEIFITTLKTN